MRRILPIVILLAGLATLLSGCAVTDEQGAAGPYVRHVRTESPARIGLPPAYRAFYDDLAEEGDWTLIEPYGYCFRPRVNVLAWRPYQDGWWEVSDVWGWVWNTDEPFGWITYHYGLWFYDEYQGWVWQPGSTWGPAWVAWVQTGGYIGWAPLPPSSYDGFDRVPDGLFTFATPYQFVQRGVAQKATFVTSLPEKAGALLPVNNIARAQGAAYNMGPSAFDLQRMGAPAPQRIAEADIVRPKIPAAATKNGEAELLDHSNAIVEAGNRQLRAVRAGTFAAPRTPAGAQRSAPPKPARRPEAGADSGGVRR